MTDHFAYQRRWKKCARCALVQPDKAEQSTCDGCLSSLLYDVAPPADPDAALKTWRLALEAIE